MPDDPNVSGPMDYLGAEIQAVHCPICGTEIPPEDWEAAHLVPIKGMPYLPLEAGLWRLPGEPHPVEFMVPDPESQLVRDGIQAVVVTDREECAKAFQEVSAATMQQIKEAEAEEAEEAEGD